MPQFKLKGIEVVGEEPAKKKRKRIWIELTPDVEAIIEECSKELEDNPCLKGNIGIHVNQGGNDGLLREFRKVRDALKAAAKKAKPDDKDKSDDKIDESGKDLKSDDKTPNDPSKPAAAQNDLLNQVKGANSG